MAQIPRWTSLSFVLLIMIGCRFGALALDPNGASAPEMSSSTGPLQDLAMPPTTGRAAVVWNNRLEIRRPESGLRLRLGLRFQNDWSYPVSSDKSLEESKGPFRNTVDFRRFWLEADGDLSSRTHFAAHVDLSGGRTAIRNLYAGLSDIPVLGTVRVGHQQEPFGLDELNANTSIVFAERALSAFYPGYHAGIRTIRTLAGERATLSYGIFRDTDETGRIISDDGYGLTARATTLLLTNVPSSGWFHIGAAVSLREPPEGVLDLRARPENRWVPPFLSATNLPADHIILVGLESAATIGSLSAQAEWVLSTASTDGDEQAHQGGYIQAAYALTGETRPYLARSGTVGGIQPTTTFDSGGIGAWEVAIRLSNLEFDGAPPLGGAIRNIGAAVNWYVNALVRASINWIRARVEDLGEADLLLIRFQLAF
ncbi:MAG: OprO/OprP family phosphate-selective porin [Kiritimatiellae bacterium]|nr:OprO/OprP family phosphate-selective porin [Kiritimatiellia bacterium]MDW8458421.1 porin [Verrucomicrobiota bacterium]